MAPRLIVVLDSSDEEKESSFIASSDEEEEDGFIAPEYSSGEDSSGEEGYSCDGSSCKDKKRKRQLVAPSSSSESSGPPSPPPQAFGKQKKATVTPSTKRVEYSESAQRRSVPVGGLHCCICKRDKSVDSFSAKQQKVEHDVVRYCLMHSSSSSFNKRAVCAVAPMHKEPMRVEERELDLAEKQEYFIAPEYSAGEDSAGEDSAGEDSAGED